MGRIAGDSDYYTFSLTDWEGNIVPGEEIHLPSVTHILGTVLGAGDSLLGWYYSKGLEGVEALAQQFGEEFLPIAQQYEELREEMNKQKLSPYHRRDERADQGRSAHDYFESLTDGARHDPSSPFEDAIETWWTITHPQVERAEGRVWSVRHGYAGTCDLIWWDSEGQLNVTDLKTRKAGSDQAYEKDLFQVDGYDLAYEEMTGMQAAKTGVLIARDDGTYVYDSRRVPRGSFLKVKAVYDMLKEVA